MSAPPGDRRGAGVRARGWTRRRMLGSAIAAVGALTATEARPQVGEEQPRYVRIATGPAGGAYFPVGALIATAISNPPGSMACEYGGSCGVPGLVAAVVSTQGSVDNLKRLVAHSVDLAFCQADVASDALNGRGVFAPTGPNGSLRALAALYREASHIVVRADSGLTKLKDLRGKRVGLGETISGTFVTARTVLEGAGIPLKEIKVVDQKLMRATEALAAKEIDAFFMVGGYPVPAIARLAESTPIALIPLSVQEIGAIRDIVKLLNPVTIPAGVYPGVAATATIGPSAQLLALSEMQDELAYAIVRAIWDPRNRKILDGGHPEGRSLELSAAVSGLVAPLHPGALRYYREAGLVPGAEP